MQHPVSAGKKTVLALLVVANIVLLVALVMSALPTRQAWAQAMGTSGNYLAVAGEVRSDNDVLYLVDLPGRTMHIFQYDFSTRRLVHESTRDLVRDFGARSTERDSTPERRVPERRAR